MESIGILRQAILNIVSNVEYWNHKIGYHKYTSNGEYWNLKTGYLKHTR